jgi:hypothetical protein
MSKKIWVTAFLFTVSVYFWSIGYAQPSGFSCGNITEVPVSECEALVAYYNSTNGEFWDFYPPPPGTDWLTNDQPCTWFGITCTVGHVTGIDLNDYTMNGTIPPEIGMLPLLVDLSLTSPNLHGQIPPELGDLTSLQTLTLDYNDLSGQIPTELGNLINLKELRFSSNQLNGFLPPSLGNLINLELLALTNNQLSGPIPPELGNLTNLEGLYLYDNQISGVIPFELGDLSNLMSMDISNNQLNGAIPPELGDLVNITDLRLAHNQLTGPIPPELGMLNNLIGLSLSYNQLSGPLPPALGSLSTLSSLKLNNNQFSSTLPSEWGNLTLYTLDLSVNPLLTGPLPDSFSTLDQLLDFNFSHTSICTPENPIMIAWLSNIYLMEDSGILCTPAVTITPSGGSLFSQDGNVQITFPTGAFTETAVVTYTHLIQLPTGNLGGAQRFFSLEATQNGTAISQTLIPMTFTVTYEAQNPIISGALKLYRLENDNWTDDAITYISDSDNQLISEAILLGWYAVLGETNGVYLPIMLTNSW